MNIKVGDKVMCTKPSACQLKARHIYTVKSIILDEYIVFRSYGYHYSSFKVIREVPHNIKTV